MKNKIFSTSVIYVQPGFEELKRRFPAYVNPAYKDIRFDPIECCKAVSKDNREVAFEYVRWSRTPDEVWYKMDRKGLRPTLYEELLNFAEKYPDEQRKYPIVALGSEADVCGSRYVAYLQRDGLGLIDGNCHGYDRFLAVRNQYSPKGLRNLSHMIR